MSKFYIVLIENSFGWAGDDTVAIKCTGNGENDEQIPNTERIIIRNNVFLTKKTEMFKKRAPKGAQKW